jgi:Secretion system C-terminal sorting domain
MIPESVARFVKGHSPSSNPIQSSFLGPDAKFGAIYGTRFAQMEYQKAANMITMNKKSNTIKPLAGFGERMVDMRKAITFFTLMTLFCIFQAGAATPPGYTGRIMIESKAVNSGESFVIKVLLDGNNYPVTAIKIPLKLSSSYLTCNYVDFTGSIKPAGMEGYFRVDGNRLEISYIPPIVFPLPTVAVDSGLVATIYFTAAAGAPNTTVGIDSVNTDSTISQDGNIIHIRERVEMSDTTGIITLLPDFTSGAVEIRHSTDLATDNETLLPRALDLAQNFPNPFNPTTTISFALPEKASVRLEIFNLLGQRVAILADREFTAGNHSLTWEAANAPSGIYFYRLNAGKESITRKMLLMK